MKTNIILFFCFLLFINFTAQVPYAIRVKKSVGNVERKCIFDIIARLYPQCIAGDILEFNFDLPIRSFNLSLIPDNDLGVSRIFNPADRHYPDGFTITIGEAEFVLNPLKNKGLEVTKTRSNGDVPELIWDTYRLQLVVTRWAQENEPIDITVQPVSVRSFSINNV